VSGTTAHSSERLSAYLDGELPPAEAAELEAHLRECAACAQALDEMLAVDSSARALAVDAPEGYFDAFPGRVRARLRARRRWKLPVWTWAAAAALLLAVVTPMTMRETRAPQPAAEVAPATPLPPRPPATPLAPAPVFEPAAVPPPAPPSLAGPAEAYGRSAPEAQPAGEKKSERQLQRLGERDQAAAGRDLAIAQDEAAKLKRVQEEVTVDKDQRLADAAAARPAAPPGVVMPSAAASAPASPVPSTLASPAQAREAANEARRRDEAASADTFSPPPARAKAAPPAGGVVGGVAGGTAPPSTAPQAADAEPLFKEAEGKALSLNGAARTPEEARAQARSWTALAAREGSTRRGDEARVRALQALVQAFKLSGAEEDREAARRALQAYLARSDAGQKERARALRQTLER
jgi:anti-sigma factor RsiW